MTKRNNLEPQMANAIHDVWTPDQNELIVKLHFVLLALQEAGIAYSKSKIAAPYLVRINQCGPIRTAKPREVECTGKTVRPDAYVSAAKGKLNGKVVYLAARSDWYSRKIQNCGAILLALGEQANEQAARDGLPESDYSRFVVSGLKPLGNTQQEDRNADPFLWRYLSSAMSVYQIGKGIKAA